MSNSIDILNVESDFEAFDAGTGKLMVNLHGMDAAEAKRKMDVVIDALSANGWVVNDNRAANEARLRREEHTDHDYARIDEEKR
jgi:hypothetical protein